MFEVSKPGQQIPGELVASAHRGSVIWLKCITTNGNPGFAPPTSSIEGAKAYMIVDFNKNDGITYTDSSDDADLVTSTPYPCIAHYGGEYKTDRVYLSRISTYKYRTGMATPEVTAYNGYSNNFNPFPLLWTCGKAYTTKSGCLIDSSDPAYTGLISTSNPSRIHSNANFWLKSVDNASADSGANSVEQTTWAVVQSIPWRIGVGYMATSLSNYYE